MIKRNRVDLTQLLLGAPTAEDLEVICEAMNSTRFPERANLLRNLVAQWRDCGRDLNKLFKIDESLEEPLTSIWTGRFVIDQNGRAHLCIQPTKFRAETSREYAIAMLAALTLNPSEATLRGPCAHPRCGKYFVKKSAKSQYCSSACCQAHSARIHTDLSRRKEREDKLARARVAIGSWKSRRSNQDWKVFVTAREPDITVRFLTRAVGLNDLTPPVQTS